MPVLLIEDDRMVGAAVEQALKDAAYAVDWVTDGEAAIHAAESEAYELALLDLGLPKVDGQEGTAPAAQSRLQTTRHHRDRAGWRR